jgi:hypothetical protein
MEAVGSRPCLEEPVTVAYPEPDQSRLRHLLFLSFQNLPISSFEINHSNYIRHRVHIMKLLLKQFSKTSYEFVPILSKILLSTQFSTPALMTYAKFQNHINVDAKVYYFLHFMFLNTIQNDKRF